jgi:hypothetical protein
MRRLFEVETNLVAGGFDGGDSDSGDASSPSDSSTDGGSYTSADGLACSISINENTSTTTCSGVDAAGQAVSITASFTHSLFDDGKGQLTMTDNLSGRSITADMSVLAFEAFTLGVMTNIQDSNPSQFGGSSIEFTPFQSPRISTFLSKSLFLRLDKRPFLEP